MSIHSVAIAAMPKLSSEKQLLGIDFGHKYIGLAVGQLITKTASPLTTLKAKNKELNWKELDNVLQNWDIQAIVVGIPLNMDGSEQAITADVHDFITTLRARYNIPVYGVDERLSTVAAKADLFEQGGYKALAKEQVDMNAAKLILEHWMKQYEC